MGAPAHELSRLDTVDLQQPLISVSTTAGIELLPLGKSVMMGTQIVVMVAARLASLSRDTAALKIRQACELQSSPTSTDLS